MYASLRSIKHVIGTQLNFRTCISSNGVATALCAPSPQQAPRVAGVLRWGRRSVGYALAVVDDMRRGSPCKEALAVNGINETLLTGSRTLAVSALDVVVLGRCKLPVKLVALAVSRFPQFVEYCKEEISKPVYKAVLEPIVDTLHSLFGFGNGAEPDPRPQSSKSLGGVQLEGGILMPASLAAGVQVSWSLLLHVDTPSGLLFQVPFAPGQAFVFTGTELGTTLSWARRALRHGGTAAAFSLDPLNPEEWESRAGLSVDGLYQCKWYSDPELRTMPLGYWMWRADWKLKQLAQGMLYDDATGQRRPLRRGADVPVNFPDVTRLGTGGKSRLWITCRGARLRGIGQSSLLMHASDVCMGVEARALCYDPSTETYEDDMTGAACSAQPLAQYLSQNYDAVAEYVPELYHCKRMAALLSLVQWLLQGPLARSELTPERYVASLTIPSDFPDDEVPALRAVHSGVSSRHVFTGGVDLALENNTVLEELSVPDAWQSQFRQWAEEFWQNPSFSKILQGSHASDTDQGLLQEIAESSAALYVFPVAERPALLFQSWRALFSVVFAVLMLSAQILHISNGH